MSCAGSGELRSDDRLLLPCMSPMLSTRRWIRGSDSGVRELGFLIPLPSNAIPHLTVSSPLPPLTGHPVMFAGVVSGSAGCRDRRAKRALTPSPFVWLRARVVVGGTVRDEQIMSRREALRNAVWWTWRQSRRSTHRALGSEAVRTALGWRGC